MRRVLPVALLLTFAALTTTSLLAQNDRFAYAITDLTKEGAGWNALRKLDLETGQYSDMLLNGTDQKMQIFDATTKKQLVQQADAKFGTLMHSPFSTGVAAAAYDRRHNRLYYTPMFVDQLRYIDLKTMKIYYVTDNAFTQLGNMHNDEGKIITRMVIAPDGYGYAISNDANTLIRFSTGKKQKIEQLGALVDDPANNGISIHNRCTSFGGDMISDDEGNLFIFSARNNVFKVNTETRVATLVGNVAGLPKNFTINGAVVDAEGNLLVSSAVDASSYYVLNPADWTASPFKAAAGVFRSSDLANSNFISSRPATKNDPADIIRPEDKFANLINVYPNPVTSSTITVQFNKVPVGNYVLELRDVIGRSVMQKRITINNETQVQTLNLDESNAKGIYMVKMFDNANQSVFTQKVVVQ